MTDQHQLPGATHLECTGTGERIESEQLVGLSDAGKPLFARYDIDAVRDRLPDGHVHTGDAGKPVAEGSQ